MKNLITISLPVLFYDDHMERCSGYHEGHHLKELWRGKRMVTVVCDQDALDEIESDADYYAGLRAGVDIDIEYRSLINSAKTTIRKINSLQH